MNVQETNELSPKLRKNPTDYWKDIINLLMEKISLYQFEDGLLFSGKSSENAKLCSLELKANILQHGYSLKRLSFEKRYENWFLS